MKRTFDNATIRVGSHDRGLSDEALTEKLKDYPPLTQETFPDLSKDEFIDMAKSQAGRLPEGLEKWFWVKVFVANIVIVTDDGWWFNSLPLDAICFFPIGNPIDFYIFANSSGRNPNKEKIAFAVIRNTSESTTFKRIQSEE